MITKLELIYLHKIKPYSDKLIGTLVAPFRKRGFNLLGYFDTPIGVAEVGRQCFLDLNKHSAFPSCIINFTLNTHGSTGFIKESPYKEKLKDKVKYSTNIIFFNADYISDYIRSLSFAQGTRNVGVFWWELEDYFYFKQGVDAVDEIIVFSDFVKQAIIKTFPAKRITKFSFPYSPGDFQLTPVPAVRKQYGLEPDDFVVFFNFDFFSVYERKNPEGLAEAFSFAFKGNNKVKLLLKTIHAGNDNENYKKLRALLVKLKIEDQVIFEDKNLPKAELMSLINATDIYVSLHRSEGLGIGMMEAMLLGKPVVATAYGGNMEFTTKDTSLLVDYELVEIDKDNGPYRKGYKWANPDPADAAKKMELLYKDPLEMERLRNNALKHLKQFHQGGRFSMEVDAWINQKV